MLLFLIIRASQERCKFQWLVPLLRDHVLHRVLFETSHPKKIWELSLKKTVPAPNIIQNNNLRVILHLKMHQGFEELQVC